MTKPYIEITANILSSMVRDNLQATDKQKHLYLKIEKIIKNNLSLHIHFSLFALVVGNTTYLQLMADAVV